MSEQPWQRQPNEPSLWYDRFTRYRLAGSARSLLGSFNAEATKSHKKPVIHVPGAWKDAAERWQWKARAEAYDAFLREIEEAEIDRIMHEGYAATHRRVLALDTMAKAMEEPYKTKDGREVPLRNMPEHLREWRGILDDIAQETGGRVKKTESKVQADVDVVGAKELLLQRLARLEGERDS